MTSPKHIDPYSDLTALLDKPVDDWKAENIGDRVVGIVVDIGEVEGQHSTFPIITLDAGPSLVRVACGRSVLAREVRSRDIREGDVLAVQYEGPKVAGSGTKYHGYRLVHKPIGRVEPARVRSVHDNEPPADYDDGSF